MSSLSNRLGAAWSRLHSSSVGRWLFSRIVGWVVPYSGTTGATVVALEPGFCRVVLEDRRRVRNHLRSVHAVALINVGEMTSGLAMTMGLPEGVRGIVLSLGAEYLAKARGTLTAEARVEIPGKVEAPIDHPVETTITNSEGTVVCRVRTVWRLAP